LGARHAAALPFVEQGGDGAVDIFARRGCPCAEDRAPGGDLVGAQQPAGHRVEHCLGIVRIADPRRGSEPGDQV
jgi:hypothetical protein